MIVRTAPGVRSVVEHYLVVEYAPRVEPCACGGAISVPPGASDELVARIVAAHQSTVTHRSWRRREGFD